MLSSQTTKKGFILSIVLWIVVVILLGITTIAFFSKDVLTLSNGLKNKLETQMVSEDILELLKYHITTSDYDHISIISNNNVYSKYKFPTKLILDNRWYSITKDIRIRIQDTSSLANIITNSPKTLATLATNDSQRQLFYTIKDSLKDWKDKDNVVSLNGAELSTYQLHKEGDFKPRNNGAIQDTNELRLINGIDTLSHKQWESFKKRIYYGNPSLVNLSLVDKRYLSYLLRIREDDAQTLIDIREKDMTSFIKKIVPLKIFDYDYMSFSLSRQLMIEIEVTKDNAKTILKSTILFKPKQNKQYTTIDYKSL